MSKNRDLIEKLGQAIHGPLWQNAVARDLGVNARQVHRWVSGEFEPRDGHVADLLVVAKAKRAELEVAITAAEKNLKKAVDR